MAHWTEFYDRHSGAQRLQANAPKGAFARRAASPATLQARRTQAKYEARSNSCRTCFLAMPCACSC